MLENGHKHNLKTLLCECDISLAVAVLPFDSL